ncbi:MAG: hypothetical protein ACYDD1_07050 [Caulobacteraceae bacterium]
MPSQSQWKAWVLSALGESAKPVTVHELAKTLAGRLDPPLEEDAVLRKVSAALRKLGTAEQAVYEAGWGWALADWRDRDTPEPEAASPVDDARRAKTEAMIAKLQAKADSTPFPHEADSLRAKVLQLKAKIAALA